MRFIILIIATVVFLVVLFYGRHLKQGGNFYKETFISPLAGPVDMLQSPKQLLMDRYRFQDALFPPEEVNLRQLTDLCPSHRQRVGIFKEKAYIDQEEASTQAQAQAQAQAGGGGGGSSSQAVILQVRARGEQDRYLIGQKGDPIVDNINLLGSPYALYAPPEKQREVNYPNQVFSWGDVLYRFPSILNNIE